MDKDAPQPPIDIEADFVALASNPIDSSECDDATYETEQDEQSPLDPAMSRNTASELRRLQRLMMQVAETDEMGSARASAARAWKELEVLRHAKIGKPLMLSVTGKGDIKPKSGPSPMILLDEAKSA